MAKNCAIVVGINDYDEIQPLKYAKADAEQMRQYFLADLGILETDLYFFSDDSPRNAQGRKTQPTYGTLESFLTNRFEAPFLTPSDTLWFYFSGHGIPWQGKDYLLPSDGNPRREPPLAIGLSKVSERLRRSGAGNVVMLIDACRSSGQKSGEYGIGQEKQQGVITFFSCSPNQVSYEIEDLRQGAFTKVLLEALRIQGEGNCATVERFAHYLRHRVPQLTQQYKKYTQVPYVVIEPETKLHYILLPKLANLADINALVAEALQAEVENNLTLAQELWMRVNVAAGGTDPRVFQAVMRLAGKQQEQKQQRSISPVDPSPPIETPQPTKGSKSTQPSPVIASPPKPPQSTETLSNRSFDLPNKGGKLEFIAVPGGTLVMRDKHGTGNQEHRVQLQPFLMGKYPVTQRQYQAVMGKNPSHFTNEDLTPEEKQKGLTSLDRPVEQVNWYKAIVFCEKLSEILSQDIDLPSETQWEWAARGATQSKCYEYAGSNNLDEVGWYGYEKYGETTHPVGQKNPNELGMYDMSGNVWEWCKDDWPENVKDLPTDGTAWLSSNESKRRLLRGGSWYDAAEYCRSAYRNIDTPDNRSLSLGFRIVCRASRIR